MTDVPSTRKTKIVPITDEGRDKGKHFYLTEMPALQAEKWAWRLFFAMTASGADVPEEWFSQGMAAVAMIGIQGLTKGLRWELVEPLLDDLMNCVRIIPDPVGAPTVVQNMVPEIDLDEPKTILLLRAEVFRLHTGFSIADVLSMLGTPAARRPEGSPST